MRAACLVLFLFVVACDGSGTVAPAQGAPRPATAPLTVLVLDEAGQPVQGANVMGQVTDFEGRAIMDVPAGQPTVVTISKKGYAPQVVPASMSGPVVLRTALIARPDPVTLPDAVAGRTTMKNGRGWRQFWEGLPEDLSAIHARKAVFEAVAQSSDPQQHERAFRMFAGFEDTRSPNGNFGLVALGKTLHSVSFLKSGEALSAIASEREANWRRVLLWSLDPSAMWPQRRGEIDSAVANAITDVLRQQPTATDELYFRLDLLGQAWRVLGPRLAAEEFREFTVSRVQNHREAASRVATAVYQIANNGDSKQPGDQEAFDAAEAHLSALFASNRYPLNNLVALVLQDSRTGERSARDILVRALGSQIRTLRKDLYKLLVR